MNYPFTLFRSPYSSRMQKGNQVEDTTNPSGPSVKSLNTSGGNPCLLKLRLANVSEFRILLMTIACFAGLTAIMTGCASKPASDASTPMPTVTSLSVEEIESYARAVLAIETIRSTAYEEIQKVTNNETVPDVTCTETKSIAGLSDNIQGIAENYCERAKKFIEDEGLTMSKFNAMTVSVQSNSELQQRIQTELARLQAQ